MNINKESLADLLKEKDDLSRLSFIDFSNYEISGIEEDCLVDFKNLHQLIINENQLSFLSNHLLKGPVLLNYLVIKKGLSVPTNDTDFCDCISKLSTISYLILSGNQIKEIPHDSFLNLANLRHLNLANNKITRIESNGFKTLINLEELNIQKNQIEFIHSSAFSGPHPYLIYLNLSWNKLRHLDKALFYDLTNLQILNCQFNQIEELNSKIFSTLYNLEQLDMSQNKIKHLKKNMFAGLNHLVKIRFDHNEICDLEDETFVSESLQTINLENNCIKSIRKNTLKGIKKLELIDLSHNMIQRIDEHAFHHTNTFENTIKEIDLNQNNLNYIHSFLFKDLISLETINLIHNGFDDADQLELFLGPNVKFVAFSGKFEKVDYYNVDKKIKVDETHNDIDLILKPKDSPKSSSSICIIL